LLSTGKQSLNTLDTCPKMYLENDKKTLSLPENICLN